MSGEGTLGSTVEREPVVSVIVVLWNSCIELPACLASLAEAGAAVPLQVICVDNGSEDRSVALARELGAQLLELKSNRGFPVAVNAGLDQARAPYVLLLNPDVELRVGTLARCLEELATDRTIGMVGANLRRVDGTPDWAAARTFRSLGSIAAETFGLTRISKRLDFQYLPAWSRETSRDVECINGAFMLLRTDLLRRLGGLDETAFMYLEDQELCRQVWEAGLRVRFVADAVATHVGGASTERASDDRRVLAYLHRTDADVEMVARRDGRVARIAALGLFAVRAGLGLGVGVVRRDAALRSKYLTTIAWLARQVPRRHPPPPIR